MFITRFRNFNISTYFIQTVFVFMAISLFLIVFIHCSLNANSNWQKASDLNQKGDRLLSQNRFDEALNAFAEAERLFSDDGFYATRQGDVYLWQKEDPTSALKHFDRALSQGGDKSIYTLRERGIAFCQIEQYNDSEKAFESAIQLAEQKLAATQKNQSAVNEVLDALGYFSMCKRDQKRYTEAIALAQRGFAIEPNTDNFALNDAKLYSEIWLAHAALAAGRYQESASRYKEAEQVIQRSKRHRDWLQEFSPTLHRELAEQRLAIERQGIKPQYIHRMQVFFIKKAQFDFRDLNGQRVVANDEITNDDKEKAILFLQVLKRQLEALSNGRFTIEYKITELNTTITKMKTSAWANLETRMPILDSLPDQVADSYCQAAMSVDTIWTFWPGRGTATTANGGSLHYPCVPYQLSTPLRGYISYPANWNTLDATVTCLHEFFHNIEEMAGIDPTHGFEAQNRHNFKGWKGSGQMDYFRWHFQNTLPGNKPQPNTYSNLNYLNRYPNVLSGEAVKANREAVAQLTAEKRYQSQNFAEQAHELYWTKKQYSSTLEMANKALALNPNQRDALLLAGLAANHLKKDQLAAQYLQRLTPLYPDLWVLHQLAYIQQWKIKDLPAAIRTFELISKRFTDEPDRYSSYGRALLDSNRLAEALIVFEQGRASSNKEVVAQSTFWKGYLLGERMNRSFEAIPLIKEGYNLGYKNSFTEFYLKKYSNSSISQRSIIPEEIMSEPEIEIPGKSSINH